MVEPEQEVGSMARGRPEIEAVTVKEEKRRRDRQRALAPPSAQLP